MSAASGITPVSVTASDASSLSRCIRLKSERRPLMEGVLFVTALALCTSGRAVASENIAVGGGHVCVITTTGNVKCWGLASKGQLGYEDTEKRGASDHTMGNALKDVDLGNGATAVSITAGALHTCVVLSDGALKCFGYGNSGQLGQEDDLSIGNDEGTMGGALEPVDLGTDAGGEPLKAVKAVAGSDFTCVLLDNREVVCFGANDFGQLGIGSDTPNVGKRESEMGNNLVPVDFGQNSAGAVDLSSGPCALLEDGKIKCWGHNLYGQAGVAGSVDVGLIADDMGEGLPAVSLGTDSGVELTAKWVASGLHHNCAVVDGGTDSDKVKCWAKNTQGNSGLGDVHDRGNDEDELGNNLDFTPLGSGVYRLDGGDDHSCALLLDGTVKCWGKGWSGQLGLGDFRTKGDYPGEMGDSLPTVFLGEGRTAVEISAGGDSTCAILDDGSVKCWGDGSYGKLGQGNSENLGDDAGEMTNMEAIDLGDGVEAARTLMSTPAPTFAPTSAPTMAPTMAPTSAPTTAPTMAPTASPTASPTPVPTASPTAAVPAPTLVPTSIGAPTPPHSHGGQTNQPSSVDNGTSSPSTSPRGSNIATSSPTSPDPNIDPNPLTEQPLVSRNNSNGGTSSSGGLTGWKLTAAIVAPISAAVVLAAGVVVNKHLQKPTNQR